MLDGSYTPWLVVVSLLVATLASFTALDMANRITTAPSARLSTLWLFGGGCAMGLGIWSMHFIGMLAFRLPIPLGYDLGWTAVSLLAASAAGWGVTPATARRSRRPSRPAATPRSSPGRSPVEWAGGRRACR